MRKRAEFILIIAIVAAFAAVAGSFAGRWTEMIAPFRLQLMVGTLMIVAVAAGLRVYRLAALAAVVALLNLAPMAWRLAVSVTLPPPAQPALSLVSANVLCDNKAYQRVVALARRESPDVFVAVETTPDWVAHLDSLNDIYPHSFTPAELGVFGLSVYARQPFQAQLTPLGPRGMPLARLEFADYVLYVVHPMPPATASLEADNRLYLLQLADIAGQEAKPVILAGDFNATLWSRNLRPFVKGRWQWPQGSGLAYSWPAGRPVMRIQIDQVLTHGFKAANYRTLEDVGSDHYPVRAELQL